MHTLPGTAPVDSASVTPRHTSVSEDATSLSNRLRRVASAEQRQSTMPDGGSKHRFAAIYSEISEELLAVEGRLRQELTSDDPWLGPLLYRGTQLGGKRLRPALLLLSGKLCGELNSHHMTLATVVELVHTATLAHDDVLDDAKTRRHTPTVNSQWSNHAGILLGDFLFARSFRLAASLGSTEPCEWVGDASRRVCEGELRQVLRRDDLTLSQADYLEILADKTAALCEVACRLGAAMSGGSESQIDALVRFGRSLGIAFQIADDLLDVWGDNVTVGKTLGTDLEQGKWTLPILQLLKFASVQDREFVIEALQGVPAERLSKVQPFLDRYDIKRSCLEAAVEFQNDALTALEAFEPSPAREALLQLARLSVSRDC